MTGAICLQGGAEFGPDCRAMDAALVDRAGGRVVISALAGAVGRDAETANANGVRHFAALGADAVAAPDARVDEAAAVAAFDGATLLFLPGGSPARLLAAVSAPAVRAALERVLERGGVLAGASAGAMVLAEWTLLPEGGGTPKVARGLGLVPRSVVLPHYSGDDRWLRALPSPEGWVALGLPECSGVLIEDGFWAPVGRDRPTLITTRGPIRLETPVAAP